MIVISGALVLVALVLLVLGLTMTDLNFVYGSIAVSLISFVFLVIGILQRRGEQPAAAGAGSTGPQVSDDGAAREAVPAAAAAKTGGTGSVPVLAAAAPAVEDERDDRLDDELYEQEYVPSGQTVLVVPGRPRYHVDGCRYLTGKAAEEVDVADARAQYSPCGVCKPDAALETLAADETDDEYADTYAEEEPADVFADVPVPGFDEPAEDVGPEPEPEPEPAPVSARRGGSRRVSATATPEVVAAEPAAAAVVPAAAAAPSRARKKAPAKAAKKTTTSRARKATPPAASAATAGPVAPVAPAAPVVPAAPAFVPAAAETGPAAAKAPARRPKVVVIPDRGRFHTQDCRFVRDVLGTEELTRTQATRQGYQACGVCKP